MAEANRSTENLRGIAEQLAATGQISENQALAYVLRSVGRMDRQETVMKMDAKPSTVDTHFQRAKQKIGANRELIYYLDIFEGNAAHLQEGMTLPAIPSSWEETFIELEKNGSTVKVYELPDNRYAKCTLQPSNQASIKVDAVGGLSVSTPDFNHGGFEDYFEEEFGIEISLSKDSYIELTTAHQTMVEYCIGRLTEGLRISGEWKYLKVTRKDLGSSPSWMDVNSPDELVHSTSELTLKSTEQLRDLRDRFSEAYQPGQDATMDAGIYGDEDGETEMQFYAHIAEAFCRATNTKHYLTFDWDIRPQSYNTAAKEQSNRFHEREYYKNVNSRYRDDMIRRNLGIDLSGF